MVRRVTGGLVEFLASPETLALLESRGFDVKP
jgi:hypothetical protein